MDLISSQDENVHDLLSSSIETYFKVVEPKAPSFEITVNQETKHSIAQATPKLIYFFMSLSNHFRASPALVRYGAALALVSIVKICPSFPNSSPQIWQFVVSGLLDSDHLTAGVYLSIVEHIENTDTEVIKTIISKLRRQELSGQNYDEIYLKAATQESKDQILSTLLDTVVKSSPALPALMIHKLANSLDYIPTRSKLKTLELLRVWGKKASKLDMYLIQMLIPLCTHSEELVQQKVLSVLESILPSISNLSTQDVSYMWKYLSVLLNPNLDPVNSS